MGCCEYGSCSSGRGFLTKSEKIEMLSDYKKQLEHEARGVSERLTELEKGN